MWGNCDDCGAWRWKRIQHRQAFKVLPKKEHGTLAEMLEMFPAATCYVCEGCGAFGASMGGAV